MALTKTGNALLEKQAGIEGVLAKLLRKTVPPLARKGYEAGESVARGAYKAVRPAAKATVHGASAAGRAGVNHPKTALPLMLMGAVGAYGAKNNFKKNWLHTDPKQNLTYKASLSEGQGFPIHRPGSIKFRDPRQAKFYNSDKSDYILY